MTSTALLCPDSFKGTFAAPEVAAAMADGARLAGWNADPCPVADGGEGTLDVLLRAGGGRLVEQTVLGPLGDEVDAAFGILADGTAVVEMARASGLGLVPAARRDPERATSYGSGQLIAAAARHCSGRLLVSVGGSATSDGGLGAVEAIEDAGGLPETRVVVLCDVDTPFEDAARVFGPQKGADPAAVERLTQRLQQIAAGFRRDPTGVPRTGGAGGLSGALWAQYGAELVSGAAYVLTALRFGERAQRAAVILTGEGRIDSQTAAGKIVATIATVAAGKPVYAVVGRDDLGPEGAAAIGLTGVIEATTLPEITQVTRRCLAAAGALA